MYVEDKDYKTNVPMGFHMTFGQSAELLAKRSSDNTLVMQGTRHLILTEVKQ